jgi:tRNA-dihydrouridine synthase
MDAVLLSGGTDKLSREALFLDFAAAVRKETPDVPLMVTGGFRSRQGIDAAIANGGCEMAGLARPSVLNPKLPKNVVLNPETQDQEARLYARRIRQTWFARFVGAQAIGASAETVSFFLFYLSQSPFIFRANTIVGHLLMKFAVLVR